MGIEETRIKIDRINFVKDTVTGKDQDETEHEFYFEQDTKIRQGPGSPERSLLQILEESGVNFPLQRAQQILVTWKPHPKLLGHRLALRIVVEKLQ
jgi:hypothetical protein